MKEAKLKTLEQSDNVSLYSICFEGNAISEYETFVQKFKDDATLNTDYKNIILALEKIVAVGAFERFFRPEGKMSDRVAALSHVNYACIVYAFLIKFLLLEMEGGRIQGRMKKVLN